MSNNTHTLTQRVQVGSQVIQPTTNPSYTGGSSVNLNETIPADSTDLDVVVALDVSAIKSLYLLSDKDLVIETNDGTTPDDTINLKAGIPYIWNTDSYDTCLLTTDVTKFCVTEENSEAAVLKMECLLDPTP